MKAIFTFLLFLNFSAYSQSADFIVLKKNNKTIETFFTGDNITITTYSGTNLTAKIIGIKNDSLFLQEFIINHLPTTIGTTIIDTAGSYNYKFLYNQIKAVAAKPHKGFDLKASGGALFGGGVLLTVASGIVYLIDKNKFSAPLLFAAMGLGTTGYILAKNSGKNGYQIGKKYKLVYMNMSK